MSSTSELSSFAARLRAFIVSFVSAPERGFPQPQRGHTRGSLGTWEGPFGRSWAAAAGDSRAPMVVSKCAPANLPAFDRLALELFALQFKHNAAYRRLCEGRGARPDTVAHWTEIPAAPTSAFKEFELSCLPLAERMTVFHSSGTTGQQPSRHYHNAGSLVLYETSLLQWFYAHCQLPTADCQLVILTPPPAEAPHSSLVHMFETIRHEVGQGGSAFVGKAAKDGAWILDAEAALERLRTTSGAGQPLLLLGTAFSFVHLLDHLGDRHLHLELPPGSCALETGGYKGRSRSLPKATLHALISQRLGISAGHIVCEYGMSELSSQAYDLAIGTSLAGPPGFGNSTVSLPLTPAVSLGERENRIPSRDTPEPFDFAAQRAKELPLHEPQWERDGPLSPSLSPFEGERVPKAGEGSVHGFKARVVSGNSLPEGAGRGEGERIDLYPGAVTPPTTKGNPDRTFHFPPWARVQIVSPETGCEVRERETGLLRVFDLANVYSVLAIQTEDLAVRRGDGFTLAGRAVSAESRGCSLMAV